jgi:hypothetical protein
MILVFVLVYAYTSLLEGVSKMNSKRFLLGALCALSIGSTSFAGGIFTVDAKEEKAIQSMAVKPGEKIPFTLQRGDATLTVGGKISNEFFFAKNPVLLNSQLPDQHSYFKHTIDTNAGLVYGEQKHGHKALELGSTLRFKTLWGDVGATTGTESEDVSVFGDYVTSGHKHKGKTPSVWVKDAWMKFSLNSILGKDESPLHFMKLGMFTFTLGRGISLGPIYGLTTGFLALYQRSADYAPPGILFSGDIVKDKLSYDLYYAKLDEKSASFGDTFNHEKENQPGRELTPWSGVAKDSDLIAARLKGTIKNDTIGKLELEPYVYYNEASDTKVEKPADSKGCLGNAGFAAEYEKGNFECGGEVAFNFGSEYIYNLDRNEVNMQMVQYNGESKPALRTVYSHITYADGDDSGKKVPVTSSTDSIPLAGRSYENSATFDSGGTNYQNASNRFRPSYVNSYRGWMGTADMAYSFCDKTLKVAASYGFASGDGNPNTDEVDRTYKGYAGLGTFYPGKRVTSIVMLSECSVKRPLTMDEGTGAADEETHGFTDMHEVGVGLTWNPNTPELKKRNFSLNPNLLWFWKDYTSPKYYSDTEAVSTTENASDFLGTEFNMLASYDLLKDLTFKAVLALFVPGQHYEDVQGVRMSGDVFSKLEYADKAALDSTRYRLGTDVVKYVKLGLYYKF